MAMFSHDGADEKGVETVIGPSVKVEGTFVSSGDVVVEGHVAGSLKTSKHLHIGEQAVVKADVEAGSMIVAGEIRGHVTCAGKIELTPTGKIIGNVDTQTIAVAHGAVLHGKVAMAGNEPSAPAKDAAKA